MQTLFFVPGLAQPGGSKRHVGGHRIIDANPAVGPWKERVAMVASEAHQGPLLDEAVRLELTFYRQRPKGHFGKRGLNKKGRENPYPTTRPDTTKLVRAVEDALTGIVWVDDDRVVTQTARKRWCDEALGQKPGVNVSIATL